MNNSFNSQSTSPFKSPKISRQHHINADDDADTLIQFESYERNQNTNKYSSNELYDSRPLISILTSSPGKLKLNVKQSPAHLACENRSNYSLDKIKSLNNSICGKSKNLSTSKLYVDDLPLSRKSSFNSVRFGPYISNQSIYNSSLENHAINSCYNSINGDLTVEAAEFTSLTIKTPRINSINNFPSTGFYF